MKEIIFLSKKVKRGNSFYVLIPIKLANLLDDKKDYFIIIEENIRK